jgi:alkanesulfonate monooxygenase SsuD/methylene tetrahydromethanopterin reductase-like flavin-dependent oxidoreductase (luciferase family)
MMVSPVTAFAPDLHARLATYRAARGHVPPEDIVWLTPIHVAEDGDQAREEARHSIMSYLQVVSGAQLPGYLKAGGDPNNLPPLLNRFCNATYEEILSDVAVVGSPAEVRDRLAALRDEFGFGHIQTWFNAGGHIPHEKVQRSMSLFMDQVAPAL